jgi:hypothetical protein
MRVAGLQMAIFAAAVLQPAVTCSLETAYGAPGGIAGLLALWFAVLLFGYLYVGRYAEALRREYDNRDEEVEV